MASATCELAAAAGTAWALDIPLELIGAGIEAFDPAEKKPAEGAD